MKTRASKPTQRVTNPASRITVTGIRGRPVGRLHTMEEVAAILGLSKRSVQRLVATGALRVHRLGRAVGVSDLDIATLLAETSSFYRGWRRESPRGLKCHIFSGYREYSYEVKVPAPLPPPATPATLQTVLDRLAGKKALSDGRKRDLRSGILSFAKLKGQPPAAIPLDLADLRATLDGMGAASAKVSPKRWANLRSDLARAIAASGLRPMLMTRGLRPSQPWTRTS